MTAARPLEQAPISDRVVELAIGQPDPSLLPAEELAALATTAIARHGGRSVAYGIETGPPPLLEWLAAHLDRIDAPVAPDTGLMITAGNSQGLDYVATVFSRAGEVALVELPTYHLALGILRDHGLEIATVATDADGLVPEALEANLERVAASGRRVALLYSIPTFGNPTGRTMPVARRTRVAELAEQHRFLVVEDDVYRELWYERAPPPSIERLAPGSPIVRLGSFSKSLAPGLRLGWVTGAAPIVDRLVSAGLVASGGGLNPVIGLAVAEFAAAGRYEANVDRLRATYRRRRDALVTALRAAIPDAAMDVPAGGYFVWLGLPDGLDANELLPPAVEAGVSYVPGSRFDASGGLDRSWLRLAYTRYDEEGLALGAQRLGQVVAEARAGR